MNEIEKRFKSVPEVEPETEDLKTIEAIKRFNDTTGGITLAEFDALNEKQKYSGKISLRVPKSLHRELAETAREEGISLNQYALSKLAK